MYESPIKIIETKSEIFNEIENQTHVKIMQQIKMHVDVDEKELLRALNYDRGQYEKGFSDGAQWASQKEIPRKPMIHNNDGYEEFARCECGAVLVTTYGNRHKYCSNCGRKIDWSRDDD